jgi:hypothetical protein
MNKFIRFAVGLSLGITLIAKANATEDRKPKKMQQAVKITVAAWGPTQADVDRAKSRVEKSRAVRDTLKGAKYRLISFNYIENDSKTQSTQAPPSRFRVVFYDYTNDRTLVSEGDFAGTEAITIREYGFEPGVSSEEVSDAFQIIRNDDKFAELHRQQKLEIFEAMPPVSRLNGERLVNVGIKILPGGENQVVGVSFKNNKVVEYEGDAPPTSMASPEACGIPSAGQSTTSNGTAGQYQLTASQGGETLWEMLVVRPSASSGRTSERSGVEVRNVKYKGKSVLKRGHVPILNVQYVGNLCGPYRDWQYAEGFFDAPTAGATDPAPGIRVLGEGQTAKTALESGIDSGNFRGVAIYTQNGETVMVSEMNAGWYRYIMEWRFAADGTIRPRYGFGATNSTCVCNPHNHHVYWRFDFDIVTPTNNIFHLARGNKIGRQVNTEVTYSKTSATKPPSYIIKSTTGSEAYILAPNPSDGKTDAYGKSDFWFLKYQAGVGGEPGELDDPNTNTSANLDPWLNGESLADQDPVVWYAAHFFHSESALSLLNPDRSGEILEGTHVVGPDLKPVNW